MNEIGRSVKGSGGQARMKDLWKPSIDVVEGESFHGALRHGSVYHDALEFRHLLTFVDDRRSVLIKRHTLGKPSDIPITRMRVDSKVSKQLYCGSLIL